MILEPMVKMNLSKFKKSYGLENTGDSDAFEIFVNHVIVASHQPDAFSTNNELVDLIHVGGENDMGIDGLAIKINDIFIDSIENAREVIGNGKKAEIEFIFIQSKYKEKFDSGEYGKFTDGILDFLSDDHNEPHNQQIEFLLKIKEFLLSEEVMSSWADVPTVRLYYVVMGTWNDNPHIIGKTSNLKKSIEKLKTYGNTTERYIDIDTFKKIYDENNNNFNCILNFVDNFTLTEVNDVNDSMIVLCKASEIVRMLESSDNSLRKSIFNDNVRDFQGNTTVNDSIMTTIETKPQNFILMNNGITIVCNKALPSNRKVTISNPQVVNGCQTCSVIYLAHKRGVDISDVTVVLKIIATDSTEIANGIVQGNNRQNIVYDEAFETTRAFHKNLEDFFNSVEVNGKNQRIYYERRSKQYMNNPNILAIQKVNFRILIQSFVSTFLMSPHLAFKHERVLLNQFENKIFKEKQSLYPYFTAPYIQLLFDKGFRENKLELRYRSYKNHLMLVFCILATNSLPPLIDKEDKIDQYCKSIFDLISVDQKCEELFDTTCSFFDVTVKNWIDIKGETHKSGIKDSEEFTKLLIKNLAQKCNLASKEEIGDYNSSKIFRGTIVKLNLDRYNHFYGYITRNPNNIFFHEKQNPDLNIAMLDKDVIYEIVKDIYGHKIAIIKEVIQ